MLYFNNHLTEDEKSRLNQINNEICHLMEKHYHTKLYALCCEIVEALGEVKIKILMGYC